MKEILKNERQKKTNKILKVRALYCTTLYTVLNIVKNIAKKQLIFFFLTIHF